MQIRGNWSIAERNLTQHNPLTKALTELNFNPIQRKSYPTMNVVELLISQY